MGRQGHHRLTQTQPAQPRSTSHRRVIVVSIDDLTRSGVMPEHWPRQRARAPAGTQPARTLSTLLAVSALLVLSSGCGGGNESALTSAASTSTTSSSTTPSAPTHAEFVSELDAWCARGNRRFAPLIAQFNKAALSNDAEGAASALQRTIPLRARYDARLHGITPSREDRAAFARFLGDETRIAGLSRRMVAALKAKDEEEANRLASLVHAARNDRTKAALDLGTTQCGA